MAFTLAVMGKNWETISAFSLLSLCFLSAFSRDTTSVARIADPKGKRGVGHLRSEIRGQFQGSLSALSGQITRWKLSRLAIFGHLLFPFFYSIETASGRQNTLGKENFGWPWSFFFFFFCRVFISSFHIPKNSQNVGENVGEKRILKRTGLTWETPSPLSDLPPNFQGFFKDSFGFVASLVRVQQYNPPSRCLMRCCGVCWRGTYLIWYTTYCMPVKVVMSGAFVIPLRYLPTTHAHIYCRIQRN